MGRVHLEDVIAVGCERTPKAGRPLPIGYRAIPIVFLHRLFGTHDGAYQLTRRRTPPPEEEQNTREQRYCQIVM